jgi:hypothetical protein
MKLQYDFKKNFLGLNLEGDIRLSYPSHFDGWVRVNNRCFYYRLDKSLSFSERTAYKKHVIHLFKRLVIGYEGKEL